MKNNYLLLLLLFAVGVKAQIISIPDAQFKAKLLSGECTFDSSDNPFQIDANGNNEIEQSEALTVSRISIYNAIPKIQSFAGVEYFTNLTEFRTSEQNVSTLDVSALSSLTLLEIYNSHLTSVNVSGLSNLEYINVSGNEIGTLDLNGLTSLENLQVYNNNLTTLDVHSLSALKYFEGASNDIHSIDFSNLSNLITLRMDDNNLQNLNLSGCTSLEQLLCPSNDIATIDVSGLPSLRIIWMAYNLLTTIDVSQNPLLWNLDVQHNNIGTIDVSQNTMLEHLVCNDNALVSIFAKNGTDETSFQFFDNPNLQYICADESQVAAIGTLASNLFYDTVVNSYCTFVPGGEFYTVNGTARFNPSTEACDTGNAEIPFFKLGLSATNVSGQLTADLNGSYTMPLQAGIHTLFPMLENPNYFNVSPSSVTVDFPTQSSPFAQDFCVSANGSHPDLEVVVFALQTFRPGFENQLKIVYKNKGTEAQSGSVTFAFDSTLSQIVTVTPTETSQTASIWSWNFSDLQPFETREINLILLLNTPTDTPSLNSGDILHFTASVTGNPSDETPLDNTAQINPVVVNSLDPNDKICLEGNVVGSDKIGEYVHYMIRFENTGTAPAQNVVISDTIDPTRFDMNSLVTLSASHDFFTRFVGMRTDFVFENINLAFEDGLNDGYIVFKVKTLPTLSPGNFLINSAGIFFDYNVPIPTGSAITFIQALSDPDFEFNDYFSLYPNPASDTISIHAKDASIIESLDVYDIMGRQVLSIADPRSLNAIDVSKLKTGTYFVRITSDKGKANAKFIKK
ncbi:T9SS type A sorting domain-containing protein [Flavobacterium sp. MAH-1]|uniref:T9SS type A sorting domain-containing protein n=1 Tax=Flavobacterium agri TaxID=2743471 RepID=A0A7Y8XZN6_9FLAO|nr:T9SS type A sorting domain-containing protein [Flavobacterium agri]NUY79886.1 T9SS type A sorting domain-containing protein [Flavobacterium agri]NYA69911.1 T9SS type A sorting domain-containing protein [Flavobacterium agri]